MTDLKIDNIAPTELNEYSQNAKKHPEAQIQQIAESITQFGFNNPILVDENNEVISGHGRLAAAKVLGLESIPIIRLAHLSEKQKRLFRLADNKIQENGGGWDIETLRLELDEIIHIDDDLDITASGFSDIEIDTMLVAADSKTKSNPMDHVQYIYKNEVVSRHGDIWQAGPHRLICGDSLNRDTIVQLLGDTRVDMVLQDPPYNLKIPGVAVGKGKWDDFAFASGEMTPDEFTNFLATNFAICAEFSRHGALIYNFIDWRGINSMLTAGNNNFSKLVNICVWVKKSAGMGSLYRSQHEMCCIFQNGGDRHNNNVELGRHGRYRTNVWEYYGVNSFGPHKADLNMHPTCKPYEMLKDCILDVTHRGDRILDCFTGSGSTMIAAHKAGRIFYGVEYEPLYVDTTLKRFYELFGIDAVHIASGKTYTELSIQNNKGE